VFRETSETARLVLTGQLREPEPQAPIKIIDDLYYAEKGGYFKDMPGAENLMRAMVARVQAKSLVRLFTGLGEEVDLQWSIPEMTMGHVDAFYGGFYTCTVGEKFVAQISPQNEVTFSRFYGRKTRL